jgi:hypothetical protein
MTSGVLALLRRCFERPGSRESQRGIVHDNNLANLCHWRTSLDIQSCYHTAATEQWCDSSSLRLVEAIGLQALRNVHLEGWLPFHQILPGRLQPDNLEKALLEEIRYLMYPERLTCRKACFISLGLAVAVTPSMS